MSQENKDQAAFAYTWGPEDNGAAGLTKREYAAIHIFAALTNDRSGFVSNEKMAQVAVQQADALFNELDKKEGE